MNDAVLTRDRILDAAEETLTRFGPAKTSVGDGARALGVSHGPVYSHFTSTGELRGAVTERWLARVNEPLAKIVAEKGPAPARLRRWFDTLIAIKRRKARAEPELFATYQAILAESREVIREHVDMLVGHIAAILADGIARGEFASIDPEGTARALFYATARFHAPVHAADWGDPGLDQVFDDLWAVVARGLAAKPGRSTTQTIS